MPKKDRVPKFKDKGGQPTKLNPLVTKNLCIAIKKGLTYKLACKLCGIHYSTFRMWYNLGRDAKEREDKDEGLVRYVAFFDEIEHADAELAEHCLNVIKEASFKDWKAGSWLAEHRLNSDYGKEAGEVAEMKEMLAQFIAGQTPELEQLKKENEELRLKLLSISGPPTKDENP